MQRPCAPPRGNFLPARLASLAPRFGRFALTGVAGFVVDASVLAAALRWLGLGLYLGRVVSFLAAATVTWLLNRSFTYGDRANRPRAREWLLYMGASLGGGAVNYAVYGVCVAVIGVAARHPTLGVAAGSIAGMLVNFASYTRLVFRTAPAHPASLSSMAGDGNKVR